MSRTEQMRPERLAERPGTTRARGRVRAAAAVFGTIGVLTAVTLLPFVLIQACNR